MTAASRRLRGRLEGEIVIQRCPFLPPLAGRRLEDMKGEKNRNFVLRLAWREEVEPRVVEEEDVVVHQIFLCSRKVHPALPIEVLVGNLLSKGPGRD